MILTKEQEAVLSGSEGKVKAKVMETVVRYGDVFGADSLIKITSDCHHFVTSFGLKALKPIYDLLDTLIEAGALPDKKFTVDPRPLDSAVPSSFIRNFVFKKLMYSKQDDYEAQLTKLGLLNEDSFTCTSYMEEVGNTPREGDILAWSESSAVVYANSVLGARCNRNSGIMDLMCAIVGYVPNFGLLTDDGRRATWEVQIKTSKKPEAQLLGSAIGMKVMEDVPYITGLDTWLGSELNDGVKAYLKDFGAATASNGAVGLFHVENITPEAKRSGRNLLKEQPKIYIIDDAELSRVYDSYPIIWKNPEAKPKLCFVGCPHLSLAQLKEWSDKISKELKAKNRVKLSIPTVFTAAPAVVKAFEKTAESKTLADCGGIISSICPLMYMNNPLCAKIPVITSSNKLRTYTTAKYATDETILEQITGGKQ